jgi:hypothetical protein
MQHKLPAASGIQNTAKSQSKASPVTRMSLRENSMSGTRSVRAWATVERTRREAWASPCALTSVWETSSVPSASMRFASRRNQRDCVGE